jgi:hypothetical protein
MQGGQLSGMDSFPAGMTVMEEHEFVRKSQIRSSMDVVLDWMIGLRPQWKSKADLTFANVHTGPETAEKAVRWWLRKVAPGGWAICGLEMQRRGTWHAHLVVDRYIDFKYARGLWASNGFSWMQAVRTQRAAVRYAVKHAIKFGDVTIYGPGAKKQFYSTGKERELSGMSPNDYERPLLEKAQRQAETAGGVSCGFRAARRPDR